MLNVRNLCIKPINADKYIIEDICFSLQPNRIYTIAGDNGTGKTLLLKSLTGLLNKSVFEISGSVEFGNKNIYELTENELRNLRKKHIRYVFQDEANAFDPLKNFKYYFKDRMIRNPEVIQNIFNKLLLSPPEKFLNSYPYEVSIGQIQRIGFALAILSDAEFIVLDEPTSAIDPINGNLYKHILQDYIATKRKTILMVTHDKIFAKKVSNLIAELNRDGLTEFKEV